MKMAKSYKIGLLLTAFIISFVAFVFCTSGASVLAATPSVASEYFSGTAKEISFSEDAVSAKMVKNSTLEFSNRLVLDNLGFELKTDSNVKKLELSFSTDPFYSNGNKTVNQDGRVEYLDTIDHALVIEFNGNNLTATFNGQSESATLLGNLDVAFKVRDNVVCAYVEGQEIVNAEDAYMVQDFDLCPAENITFKALELIENANETKFLMLSVDQDTTDNTGARKQSFKLNGNDQIDKLAVPMATVNGSAYNDGVIYMKKFVKNTLVVSSFSVFGDISASNLYLSKVNDTDKVWIEDSNSAKALTFTEVGSHQVQIKCSLINYNNMVFKTLDVEVYDNDDVAPTYLSSTDPEYADLYAKYLESVAAATKEYDKELDKEVYIKLGENYQVPSLRELVKDNYISYDNLNKTVYYKTPSNDTASTTGDKIPVNFAGDYTYYVVFSDKDSNAMEVEDFFTVDENDENAIVEGKYFAFVFSFHIEDQSAFTIEGQAKQGTGYVGTQYSATNFKINASDYSETYTLSYNAKRNATSNDEGWVTIIKKADLTDSYDSKEVSAEEVNSINYDGRITFTPHKVGTYRITCEITSDNTSRSAVAETFIGVVDSTEVKPHVPLTTRQIWAIVFLSVGGLCLVGIITLIFIKPKEKTDVEDND